MHATNARHCGTCICESSCETKTIRDCKVLWNVSASIVKGPKNTQSYSLAGFSKGSSQDIKMPKKAIYLEHYKRRYKGLILKVWNSIFLCILSEVYIIASFLLQSLIFYQHNINPNLPNDGYLGKFLENSKLMFTQFLIKGIHDILQALYIDNAWIPDAESTYVHQKICWNSVFHRLTTSLLAVLGKCGRAPASSRHKIWPMVD